MIRSESGALLPATFKSGKFAEWKKSRRRRVDAGQGSDAQPGGLASAQSIVKDRRIKEKVRSVAQLSLMPVLSASRRTLDLRANESSCGPSLLSLRGVFNAVVVRFYLFDAFYRVVWMAASGKFNKIAIVGGSNRYCDTLACFMSLWIIFLSSAAV